MVWRLLEPLVTWAYHTQVSESIRQSRTAVAYLEVLHLFGLIFLLGSVLMVGLRSVGVAMPRDSMAGAIRKLAPATIGGLGLLTISGLLIFASGATRYVDNGPFQVKMVCYLTAVVVQSAMYVLAVREDSTGRIDRVLAVLGGASVLLWFSVGIAGRAIAFV